LTFIYSITGNPSPMWI